MKGKWHYGKNDLDPVGSLSKSLGDSMRIQLSFFFFFLDCTSKKS